MDDTEWERLLWASPQPTPFLSRTFLAPWAASFAGGRPLRVGRFQSEGRTLGLAFFYEAEDRFELLGGQEVADRLDLLAEPGREHEVVSAFLQEAAGWSKPLRMPNLREDAVALEWIPRLRPDSQIRQTDSSPFVRLPARFEDYLDGLSKKQRHELRRKIRRCERLAGPSVYEVDETGARVDEFFQLHRSSHPDKREFMDARMEAFFRAVLEGFAQRGHLRLALLALEGVPAAAMLQIAFGNVLHLYNSGFDPRFSHLAPGVVLLGACLRSAVEAGCSEYDFLRGTERYKLDLGGQDRGIFCLDLPLAA